MTEVEPHAPARTVLVSPEALARICPEREAGGLSRPGFTAGVRARLRLAWVRLLFRANKERSLRCQTARLRLRLRLIWVRLRHWRRLS